MRMMPVTDTPPLPQLQELLAKEQEAFCLKSYIADRRSKLKKPSFPSALQHRKRREVVRQGCSRNKNVCCFLPFQRSPDFYSSPLFEFTMAAKGRSSGFRMFTSLLQSLSCRSTNQKPIPEESNGVPCCRSSRFLSTAEWIEKNVALEFAEGRSGDIDLGSPRFCVSPFVFTFHGTPSSPATDTATPKFHNTTTDDHLHQQEKEPCRSTNPGNEGQGDDGEEHSSPVSVLEPPFDDEDDNGNGNRDAEEGINDYDLDTSFQNLQRARQQILSRISRFERLAGLDPIELEKTLAEDYSEDDDRQEADSWELNDTLPLHSKTFLPTNPKLHEEGCTKISLYESSDKCNNPESHMVEAVDGFDARSKYEEEVEEITGDIVIALCLLLVQEVWEMEGT